MNWKQDEAKRIAEEKRVADAEKPVSAFDEVRATSEVKRADSTHFDGVRHDVGGTHDGSHPHDSHPRYEGTKAVKAFIVSEPNVTLLTVEETETLVRLRNMGNMSQPDAAMYHKLLNKEAGVVEVV